MELHSYPNNDGGRNMQGMNRFVFIDKTAVTYFPEAVNNIISDDITTSVDWSEGYITWESDELIYEEQITLHGSLYKFSFKGIVPRRNPTTEALFFNKRNHEFINLFIDNNNTGQLFGNLNKGLKFRFRTIPIGYEFEYYGEFTEPQPFYEGNFSVGGSIYSTSLNAPNAYVRAARWHNGSGAPSNSLGNDFDYYLDNITSNYYSKINGIWGYIGQLVDQQLQEFAYITAALKLTGN